MTYIEERKHKGELPVACIVSWKQKALSVESVDLLDLFMEFVV